MKSRTRSREVYLEDWGPVKVPDGWVLFAEHPIEKKTLDQIQRPKRILQRRMLYVVAVRRDSVPPHWICPSCKLVMSGPFIKGKCLLCRK